MRGSGQLGLDSFRMGQINGWQRGGWQRGPFNERTSLIKHILGKIMHDECKKIHQERVAVNKRRWQGTWYGMQVRIRGENSFQLFGKRILVVVQWQIGEEGWTIKKVKDWLQAFQAGHLEYMEHLWQHLGNSRDHPVWSRAHALIHTWTRDLTQGSNPDPVTY